MFKEEMLEKKEMKLQEMLKKTTMLIREKLIKEVNICLDGRGLGRERTLMTSYGTEKWKMVNSFLVILPRTIFSNTSSLGRNKIPRPPKAKNPRLPRLFETPWCRSKSRGNSS